MWIILRKEGYEGVEADALIGDTKDDRERDSIRKA
jgi:hypothetical protein